tara:strand:+ start:110 stop:217 length:108 start_codon:yes stop_codon:yes gene_type:complete
VAFFSLAYVLWLIFQLIIIRFAEALPHKFNDYERT